MMGKQTRNAGERPERLQMPDATGDPAFFSDATATVQFCCTLLKADTFEDVLSASWRAISSNSISGLTLLLRAGPDTDHILEVAASWPQDGQLPLPRDIQFSTQDHLFESLSRSDDAIIVNDLASDDHISEYARSILLQSGTKALVMVPLGSAHNRFGALLVCRAHATPFDEASLQEFETVASLSKGTIEKLWLVEKNKRAFVKI